MGSKTTKSVMKKLFLLDGMALIYRAHFALSKTPRFTSNGLNTSAVMGFTNTLLDVLKKEKPTHMAVVFDTAAPTERHIEFEAYKAQRESMPEDLSKALPYIFKVVLGFNIPLITSDGYEADDIIGTLAKKAEQKGYHAEFEKRQLALLEDLRANAAGIDKLYAQKEAKLVELNKRLIEEFQDREAKARAVEEELRVQAANLTASAAGLDRDYEAKKTELEEIKRKLLAEITGPKR